MSKKRKSIISTFSAQITSTISVTLVLLILGIVAILGVAAHNITNNFKGNVGFVVMLKEDITTTELNALKQKWRNAPYVASQRFIPAEEVFNQEMEHMGEDVLELMAGINPYQPEFEIKVKPQFANRDSIDNIKASLAGVKGIDEVLHDTTNIDTINENINKGVLILSIVAAALILISFVLINNSVRLTVYSKRFIIHTMKLVGATDGFIRRPFILNNVFYGFIAALIANLILASALYYFHTIEHTAAATISWKEVSFVFGGLIVVGIIICASAALFATNKYLRSSYDDMFK